MFDDRSNNYLESYNGEVNKKLKTKPVLLKFCDFLRGEENKAEIWWLQSGKKPYFMKKQTKAAKTKLESERTLQSMLKDNKLDLDSYIAKYAYAAFELCAGNNPASIHFIQNEMRAHYQSCIDDQLMSSFPQTQWDEQLVYQARRLNRK